MKHNMNRILTTMALLVLTTMTAWAEQKVNVTVTPANSGSVTYAVSNGVCTLTAKPADGYYITVDNLKAVATLDGGAVQTPQRRIEVVDGTELEVTPATGDDPSAETTYTIVMPEDANLNVEVTAEFQSRTSIEGATVTVVVPEGGIIYNGEEQKPAIASVVLPSGVTLTSTDYTVAYSNNINVGNNAEATVVGQGKYKGSATGTFTIGKADFSTVTIGAIADQTFTGAEIKPAVTVTFNGKSVSEDEYNVAYSDNVNAGTAMVTLTSKDKNFSTAKRKTATFKINPAKATLSFDKSELSAAVNGTPEWPVLNNPQGAIIAYTSSRPEVAEVDKDGLVTMKGTGTTIITAVVNDPNYQGADASYKLIVTSKAYKLKIDGIVVTDDNREDLFDKSVMFDGVATLTLTKAHISGIESGLDALEIYVIGDNFIESETAYAIWDMTGGEQSLYIYTDMTEPGRLELYSKTQVVSGFKEIDIKEPMTIIDPDYMEALNEADNTFAVLGTPMDPIVTANNKNTIVDYSVASSAGSGGVSEKTLTNVIVDNVLYTLDDKQEPGLNDDGYADGMLVINSVTNQEGLEEAIKLKPGSPEYANKFKGVTFMVPAGFGEISFTVLTKEGHALCVNVGGDDPRYYQSSDTPEFFTRNYCCTSATYVYIYHIQLSDVAGAPAEGNHRIGPKASVSTGITGLSVSANCIDTPPGGKPNYVSFSRDDLMIPESGVGHIVVSNDDITDVDEDAFGALTGATSNAPERAAQNYDISYIDLRGTSITGKVFSREEGPFKGLPETTFVYLPAGNETTSPNMVVGSVCNEVQLGDKQHRFEVAEGGFTTSKASLNRPFTVGQKQPVYLPFDIQAPERYGTFYEFDSFTNGVVKMKKAATVEANKPYYLQRSEDGEGLIVEDGVTLKPLGSVEQSQFVGTYEPKIISGDSYTYDNYLRMFFQATSKRVSPFEAYLTNLNGQNEMLTTQWEGEPTAVRTVTAESGDEGKWYTLDGRLLQHQPVERGIYLKNGKKYIVK